MLLMSNLTLFSQEKSTIAQEKIQQITLFRSQAEIKSVVEINLNSGSNTVIIDNLPKSIIKNSIQISSAAGIRIIQIAPISDYKRGIEQTAAGQKLADSLNFYHDLLNTFNTKKFTLQEELEILLANKNLTNKTDIAGEIEDLTAIYRTRIPSIKEDIYRIDKKIKTINSSISQIEKSMNALSIAADFCSLKITLAANENGVKNIMLNYLVENAGWNPIYDLRVTNISSPILLHQKASVFQNTGIDWEQVKITLSTGNPTDNGILPNLNPLFSDLIYYNIKSLDMIAEKSAIPMLAQSAAIQFQENQLANIYKINALTSIASSQEAKIIEIKSDTVSAFYQYKSIPKLDPNAYLIARIPNWNNLNLLPGNASIYVEGAFVGDTYFNTIQMDDTLQVSLGKDQNILVEREKVKEFNSTKLLTGYRTASLNFNIRIKNNKNIPINLTIEDQAPISKNKSIEVKLHSSDGTFDSETGNLNWKFNLTPQALKSISFGYEVKYPKNKMISGLE